MKYKLCLIACFALSSLFSIPQASGQSKDIEALRKLEYQRAMELKVRAMQMQAEADALNARMMVDFASAQSGNLMHNTDVQKDLELDQDQIKELKKIQQDFNQQVNEEMKSARSGGGKFDTKKWSQTYQRLSEERKSAMGAVLLPHQSKRLEQIRTQMQIKSRGDLRTLVGQSVAEELGIDEDQKNQLKKRSAEINAELQEEIAKLKEQAREKLLRELRPDQRKKFKEMVGEKFVPQKSKRK